MAVINDETFSCLGSGTLKLWVDIQTNHNLTILEFRVNGFLKKLKN